MEACKWPELYQEWSLGDANAALVMGRFAHMSQVADDFVDEEIAGSRSKAMIDLLHIALVSLPMNPFYAQNQVSYIPIIIQVLVMYDASNEWYDAEEEDTAMFSFVWREATELLIQHTAYLVGGLQHACLVTKELREHWEKNDPDKLVEWDKERNL